MRRSLSIWLWVSLSVSMVIAQDISPSIPVGLSDPYLIFVPVGWRAETPNPFGFVQIQNDALTLNVLDPVRFEEFIPFAPDTSPRQLLIDYTQFFYVETLSRQAIDLLTIGENTVALYRDPQLPAFATYVVELSNQRFAVIEVEAVDGTYDDEENVVHAIIGTLTISSDEALRTDVLYDSVLLPSGKFSLALPPDWRIEPSFVPGQIFLVSDEIELITFPPDSLSGYVVFPKDVPLASLAQVIEQDLFDIDLTNITLTSAQAGNRELVAYGFRSLNNNTDTQVLLVRLPNGDVGYFKVIAPQDRITPVLEDRIRRIALSLKREDNDTINTTQFDDEVEAIVLPNSGQWQIELRDMMRFVCDGTLEQLLPLSAEIRELFGDFETIVVDPDGKTITIASDGVVNLFQRGTLQRDNTPYYQVTGDGLGYTLTPIDENTMRGRLNIITPNNENGSCRIGVSLMLHFVE